MKNKRKMIFIIVCIVIILAVVAVLLVKFIGHRKDIGNGEGKYKISYREVGKKIRIELQNSSEDGYEWMEEISKSDVLNISDQSNSKKKIYNVEAKKSNVSSNLYFYLRNVNFKDEYIYKVSFYLDADNEGKLNVVGTDYFEVEKSIGGEIAGLPYHFLIESDGILKLIISYDPQEKYSWELKKDNESLSLYGPDILSDGVCFTFLRNGSESAEEDLTEAEKAIPDTVSRVEICCEQLEAKIKAEIKVSEQSVSVISHSAENYEIPNVTDEEAKAEFEKKFGETELPEKAKKIQFNSSKRYLSDEDNEGIEVAIIIFFADDVKWYYQFSDETKDETIFTRKFSNAENVTKSEETIGGIKVHYTDVKDNVTAATWEKNGRVFGLSSSDGTLETLKNLLKEII